MLTGADGIGLLGDDAAAVCDVDERILQTESSDGGVDACDGRRDEELRRHYGTALTSILRERGVTYSAH